MSKKLVYLCGPITGLPNFNFEEFKAAQEKLEALGYDVLNPHEICERHPRTDFTSDAEYWEACMRSCLSQLPLADMIVTLVGWENSTGAKIEVGVARLLGFIPVHYIITFLKNENHG